MRGGTAPSSLVPGRYAVLIGEEASGLPESVVSASAMAVTISMPGGTESLNAAVAAGMILYELAKREAPDQDLDIEPSNLPPT